MSYKSHQDSAVDNGLNTKEMAYTEFIKELEDNNVEKATISLSSPTFVFYLNGDETPYISSNPGTEDFKEKLLLSGVSINDTTYSVSEKRSSPYVLLTTAASCLLTSVLFSIMSLLLFSMKQRVSEMRGSILQRRFRAFARMFASLSGAATVHSERWSAAFSMRVLPSTRS